MKGLFSGSDGLGFGEGLIGCEGDSFSWHNQMREVCLDLVGDDDNEMPTSPSKICFTNGVKGNFNKIERSDDSTG